MKHRYALVFLLLASGALAEDDLFVIAGHLAFEHAAPQTATIIATNPNGISYTAVAEPNAAFVMDVVAGSYTLIATLADGTTSELSEPVTVPPSKDNVLFVFDEVPADEYEPDNSADTAKPIAKLEHQQHSIHQGNLAVIDVDHVVFHALPGVATAELLELSSGLELGLTLYDAAGNELPRIIDVVVRESPPIELLFTWAIPSAGDYTLRIEPIAGSRGYYDLSVDFLDTPTPIDCSITLPIEKKAVTAAELSELLGNLPLPIPAIPPFIYHLSISNSGGFTGGPLANPFSFQLCLGEPPLAVVGAALGVPPYRALIGNVADPDQMHPLGTSHQDLTALLQGPQLHLYAETDGILLAGVIGFDIWFASEELVPELNAHGFAQTFQYTRYEIVDDPVITGSVGFEGRTPQPVLVQALENGVVIAEIAVAPDNNTTTGMHFSLQVLPGSYHMRAVIGEETAEFAGNPVTVPLSADGVHLVFGPPAVEPDEYEPNDSLASAKPITNGEVQDHSIHLNAAGSLDIDHVVFHAFSGGVYAHFLAVTEGLHFSLALFDPAGNEMPMIVADPAPQREDFNFVYPFWQIQVEGDYTLRLSPVADFASLGHYSLKLEFADSATHAVVAGQVTGADSAHIVVFDAVNDGPPIAEQDADANGAFSFELPSPGTYVLDASAGNEQLTATVQVPPDVTTLLFAFSPPPVSVTLAAPQIAEASPIAFHVIFERPMSGLAIADLVVTNGSVDSLVDGNAGYTALVTPQEAGPVTFSIPAGVAHDANGVPNAEGSATSLYLPNTGCNNMPDWEPPVGVQNTMTIHAQITVNGQLIDAESSRLAAFQGSEIRGVSEIANGPAGAWFQLAVGSNLAAENGLTLVVFDADSCEICDVHGNIAFAADTTLGQINAPVEMRACEATQEIGLVQGWNWLSFNVAPGDPSLDAALQLVPAASDHMEFKTAPHLGGVATFFGGSWIGMPNGIRCGARYLLFADSARTLTLSGQPCTGGIPIVAGWNWLGYKPQEAMPVNVALANFAASNGDELKTAPHLGGTWTYFDGQWFGQDVDMMPGAGYLLRSSSAGQLSYNDDPNFVVPLVSPQRSSSRAAPDWTPPVGIQNTMTVHATVTGVSQVGSKLAAFKDGEVRGVANLIAGPGGNQFILSIGSNAAAESGLSFAVYDAATDSVCDITQSLDFAVDTTVGLINQPMGLACVVEAPNILLVQPNDASVDEDGQVTIMVTAEGEELTWSNNGPQHGSLLPQIRLIPAGDVRDYVYAPADDYNGSDSFTVTVSNAGGSASVEIPIIVLPVNDPPENTVAPSISGDLEVGATLTASPGSWNDNRDLAPGNISFTYQWQVLGDGEEDIDGANTDSLVLGGAFAGRKVRFVVTAADDGEGNTVASAVANSAFAEIAEIVVEPLDVTQTPGADASIVLNEDSGTQVFSVSAETDGTPEIHWSVDGVTVASSASFSYAPGFDAVAHPARGRDVSLSCSVNGTTVSWTGLRVVDVDRMPSLPGIRIVPEAPDTKDDLTIEITEQEADPDGDVIASYAISWTLLGNAREAFSGSSLAASETQKHNIWEASVRPITNPYGEVDTATLEATRASVTVQNSVPEAGVHGTVLTGIGASVGIILQGSDADLLDTLSFIIDDLPDNGTLVLVGDTVTYTPVAHFLGEDSFCYAVSDGESQSAAVTVDLLVQGWLLPIAATEAQVEDLLIGMHGLATDDFDVGIDNVSPPGGQDTATIGFESAGQLLSQDLRAVGDQADWPFSVDASAALESVIISWNTDVVPELGLFLEEVEGDLSLDMRAVNQLSIAPGEVRSFVIHYGAIEFTLKLREGWNIISVPVQPINSGVEAVLGNTSGVWEWQSFAAAGREEDPTGEFVPAEEIVPKRGYFVLSSEPREIIVRGSIVSDGVTDLQQHWTLFGVSSAPPFLPRLPATALNPGDLEIQSHIWRWSGRRYRRTLRLHAGIGYWVFSDFPAGFQPFREAEPGR